MLISSTTALFIEGENASSCVFFILKSSLAGPNLSRSRRSFAITIVLISDDRIFSVRFSYVWFNSSRILS